MPTDEPDQDSQDPSSLRAYAEQAAAEAREAREALAALQRKDAFRDAGLDPTDKLHAALIRGYDGELDGVPAYVEELGLKSQVVQPDVAQDEQDTMSRIAGIGSDNSAGQTAADADLDAQMREVTAKSVREGWTNDRYNDEMRALASKRGPVAQLQYQPDTGGLIRP